MSVSSDSQKSLHCDVGDALFHKGIRDRDEAAFLVEALGLHLRVEREALARRFFTKHGEGHFILLFSYVEFIVFREVEERNGAFKNRPCSLEFLRMVRVASEVEFAAAALSNTEGTKNNIRLGV